MANLSRLSGLASSGTQFMGQSARGLAEMQPILEQVRKKRMERENLDLKQFEAQSRDDYYDAQAEQWKRAADEKQVEAQKTLLISKARIFKSRAARGIPIPQSDFDKAGIKDMNHVEDILAPTDYPDLMEQQHKIAAEERAEKADIRSGRRGVANQQEMLRYGWENKPKGPDTSPWITFVDPKDPNNAKSVRRDSMEAEHYSKLGWLSTSRQMIGTPEAFTGTESQVGEDIRSLDFISDLKTDLDSLIESGRKDPTIFGLPGTVRRGLQTTFGVGRDFGNLIGQDMYDRAVDKASSILDSGEADLSVEEQAEFFNNKDVSSMQLYENSLGLGLARIRHPEGRIPVDVIRRSISDVRLTGLRSSQDVINRLDNISRQFEVAKDRIAKRVGRSIPTLSPEEAVNLPSGTKFRGTDGRVRTKK